MGLKKRFCDIRFAIGDLRFTYMTLRSIYARRQSQKPRNNKKKVLPPLNRLLRYARNDKVDGETRLRERALRILGPEASKNKAV